MNGRFYPGWHLGGFGVLGGLFGIVLFALFISLLVWAVIRLMQVDHRPHTGGPPVAGPWGPRDSALEAARIRYARGELDRDQYFRVVEDLTGIPRPAEPPAPPAEPAPTEV